jgi:hypothetical protein
VFVLPDITQKTVDLPTNDIVYDKVSHKLYASVPSAAGLDRGNTVTVIDPVTGSIGPSVYVGSEPGKLALSDDGQFLYVALNATPVIKRLTLATMTTDLQFNGTLASPTAGWVVSDVVVWPGKARTVIVGAQGGGSFPPSGTVTAFDDGIPRPSVARYDSLGTPFDLEIAGGEQAAALYGLSDYSFDDLKSMFVGEDGVFAQPDLSLFGGSPPRSIRVVDGRLYAADGRVFDLGQKSRLGSFDLIAQNPGSSDFNPAFAIDATANRAIFIYASDFDRVVTVRSYDLGTFLPRTFLELPLAGSGAVSNPALTLARMGPGALAYRIPGAPGTGKVVLIAGLPE